MSYPFGITGIGNNPYMNLGGFGLPTGGTYSSYYSPYSSGMMGLGFPGEMGMTGMMGMPGMMSMYNPTFMSQMNNAYQNMEKAQLSHAGAMHDLMLHNRTDAFKAEDTALFRKALVDNSIHSGIENLALKVQEGDADGICEEFDKLKLELYKKYNAELKANDKEHDIVKTVTREIENLYAAIISKEKGRPVTLRSEIMQYGEGAFMHGFNKAFLGKKDYHDKYTEETLKYLYGTRIDNKGGKDRIEGIGAIGGRTAEVAAAGAAGAALGVAGAGVARLAGKSTSFGKWGKFLGAAAAISDFAWQLTR